MRADYDRLNIDFQNDPYPYYRQQRADEPVHYRGLGDGTHPWWLTRYADIARLLKDPRMSARKLPQDILDRASRAEPGTLPPVLNLLVHGMLVRDPPVQSRLRKLVNRAFTPRMVEGLRPRIQRLADELLVGVGFDVEFDIIETLASKLPIHVICEMVGFPQEDSAQVRAWVEEIAPLLDGTLRDANAAQIEAATTALTEYSTRVIRERRTNPTDDLITHLLQSPPPDDELTNDELVATIVLLIGAGYETTVNMIGNGMLALLEHPSELDRLRQQPELLPSAVDELLRFDGPIQVTSRIPSQNIRIGGATLPQGQEVDLVLGAANRDPEVFVDPDRLDLGRKDNRHLAFGHGIHFCLGAALARLQGEIALGTLLSRFPRLEWIPSRTVRRRGVVLRGLASLYVAGCPARHH